MSAFFTEEEGREGHPLWKIWCDIPGVKIDVLAKTKMEEVITKCESPMNFQIVRLPTLSFDPITEKQTLCEVDGNFVKEGTGIMPRG